MKVVFETTSEVLVYNDGLSVIYGNNTWLGDPFVNYQFDANYFDEVDQQYKSVMKRYIGDPSLAFVQENMTIVDYEMINSIPTPVEEFTYVFKTPIGINYELSKYYLNETIKDQIIQWYENIGVSVEFDEIFVSGINADQLIDYPKSFEMLNGFPASVNKLPATTKMNNNQLGVSGRQLIRRTFKDFNLYQTKYQYLSVFTEFIAFPNTQNLDYYLFAFSPVVDPSAENAVWSIRLEKETYYEDYDQNNNPVGSPLFTGRLNAVEYLDSQHPLVSNNNLVFAIGLYKTGNETNIRNAGRLKRAYVELS